MIEFLTVLVSVYIAMKLQEVKEDRARIRREKSID